MRFQERYHLKSLAPLTPNIWDIIVLALILGIFAAIAWGASQMTAPYEINTTIEISLEPKNLFKYSISTVLRMFIALFFSCLFTFTIAPLAAKNKQAEKFIIPFIDIMQSVPVLCLLSITVVGFIHLFPNSLLGPECAAIFAIFTSQVWNMALSLYQSLRTVPKDLQEAATMYRLSGWQRFWRIEVPHGTPPLLWNTMVSMSAGWFFVVYSEAIEVSQQKISLPGIGSYISKAINESNLTAMLYAIIAMLAIILLYDQLLFRPLLAWSEKFKAELDDETSIHESWFFDLLAKTRLLKFSEYIFDKFFDLFLNSSQRVLKRHLKFPSKVTATISKTTSIAWNIILSCSLIASVSIIAWLIHKSVPVSEIMHVIYLGGITAFKVLILIIIASLIWIPVGVWIGLNPKATGIIQPLIQFLAAFPANFFYPLAVLLILKYNLNRNIWTMPLMILGTQWYILFNVIGGTSNIPKEIKLAAKNFSVKGWLWWRKMAIPAIFPHYITGAMTAAGGCWNASIVAEYVEWGDNTVISLGIGQYITEFTKTGDFPRIALGTAVMCIYVILFNRLLWQKLYSFAESRFTLD